MLISIDWIKDFVELPDLSPQQIADRFTMGTAEVEEVISEGEFWEQVVVAKVVGKRKHPEADKLNLVTVEYPGFSKEVVCGAANVREGLNIAYAPVGVTLPIGLTLEPKKIRGVLSEGMVCSKEELALSDSSEGIWELPDDAPIGTSLLEYLDQRKDILLDIDNKSLTHRPDLWGHYGMAREFAALFDKKLQVPYDNAWADKLRAKIPGGDSPVTIKVHKDSAGLAYYGLSVDGVKVGESPEWMKRRIKAVGLRPINNIVDISNYVMWELGIPLHIFDRNEIRGGVVEIMRLTEEEKFVTLDESERSLTLGDTVICDTERPLVLAGIMGGLNSGVTENTDKVFIEVANWKASEVRKTSTRLGLRTDSSQRYEKTLDSKLCERTLLRTLELICELCPNAKVVGKMEYDGDDLSAIEPLKINTSVAKIEKVLGEEITVNEIVRIFRSLDFEVTEKSGDLSLVVPSYRATKDIECEADLIEEIGRVIGYDNITPVSPKFDVVPVRLTPANTLHRKIKDFLSLHGRCIEGMTYPLVGKKLLDKASWNFGKEFKIINSLSKDHDRLRESLIPSLLSMTATNVKYQESFRFFELGRTYIQGNKTFSEDHNQLAIVFYHKTQSTFVDLANTVETLLGATNIPGDLCDSHPKFKNSLVPEEWMGVHPHEFQNIRIMGRMMGAITSVHPLVLRSFKIKGHLSIAIIDLHGFESRPMKDKTKYTPLPKFPGSQFDWTVEVDRSLNVGDVLSALKKVKIKEMAPVKVVDIFEGNSDKRSVTLRAVFSDPERTLDSEFLTNAQNKLIETCSGAGFALKQ